MQALCSGCGVEFEARRTTARFCSSTCRSRARRRAAAPKPDPGSPLVAAVRREVAAAGRLHTVDGQLALLVAAQLSGEGVTGATALSRELRQLVARVCSSRTSGPGDELSRARRRREEKARRAGESGDA